jgi:hypothetical protein
MSPEKRKTSNKEARVGRASRIRAQIDELKKGRETESQVKENPAAFVHRRMTELAQREPTHGDQPATRPKSTKRN